MNLNFSALPHSIVVMIKLRTDMQLTSLSNLIIVIICKLKKSDQWAQRKNVGMGEGTMAEDHREPEGQ